MKGVNVFVILIILSFSLFSALLAESPNELNYQGYLTDASGDPLTGSYNMQFTIYDALQFGSSKWTEFHSGVNVNEGLFSVILGSINPILDTVFIGQDRYLQIQVGTQTISPRTKITASAYSQQVGTIDGAGGGVIDGGIIIVPDNFTEQGNALDVQDLSGNSVVTISVTSTSAAFMDFYDPVDSKDGRGFGRHYAQVGKNGIILFGLTPTDTLLRIRPDGDIISAGQIAVGQSSTNVGTWSTVFGYNNQATADTSTVTGGSNNSATEPLAVVSGGGSNISGGFASVVGGGQYNDAYGYTTTIGGGNENFIEANYATIAGGSENAIGGNFAAIGGGQLNYIDAASHGTVAGGYVNSIDAGGLYATISGGFRNYTSNDFSVIPGGYWNQCFGDFSFVAGSKSVAYNKGCFIWADASDTASIFESTGDNQFLIRADGGVGIGTMSPGTAQLKVETSKEYAGQFDTDYGSNAAHAVHGEYTSTGTYDGVGVYGRSTPQDYYGYGGRFRGGFRGVLGEILPTGTGGAYIAVYGYNSGQLTSGSKFGVYGYAYGTGTGNYGVYGSAGNATTNYAGYFSGNVGVSGTLSKGAGSFKIDHPLDPEHKYLYHSFVESPDMMNVYNGNVVLDGNGEAIVSMPDYFTALNRDFRYQLTCIGGFAPVYIAEEIQNNKFIIAGGEPGLKVSWQVTGIRQDPFANANRIPVEEYKTGDEDGRYLHPKVFGKSNESGVDGYREAKVNERTSTNEE